MLNELEEEVSITQIKSIDLYIHMKYFKDPTNINVDIFCEYHTPFTIK